MNAPDDHEALRERLWHLIAGVRDASPRRPDDAPTDNIADALLAAGWRDDGDERAQRARAEALREAEQAFNGLHLMHGSTSICWGGIGGAAMTSECAIDCPNPKHAKAQHDWRNIVRESHGEPPEPYRAALDGGPR